MGDPVRSLNTIMIWQTVATILLAILSAWLIGVHGAISALLGGAVALAGGIAFKMLAPSTKMSAQTADMAWAGLIGLLKAEGAKVGVIVVLLWLVLANYKEVVMLGFIGTFIVAVIIFSMAIFLRNPVLLESSEAGKNNVN